MKTDNLGNEYAAEGMSANNRSFVLNTDVYYEIIAALGVAAHDPTDLAVWEHVNFSRMGHARGLKDFFEHSKDWRKKHAKLNGDDVVSEDFGYTAKDVEIPPGDVVRLNKDLFHVTYARLRHLKRPEQKQWPHSILAGIHTRCVDFIRHLLGGGLPSEIQLEVPKWRELLGILESKRELGISYWCELGKGDSGWRVAAGRQLVSGLSELTEWYPRTPVGCTQQANATSQTVSVTTSPK